MKQEETIYNTNMKRNRMALSTCYQTRDLTCRGIFVGKMVSVIQPQSFYALGYWFANFPPRLAVVAKLETL